MSLEEHISRIKFFNKKAEKLRRLSFTQTIYTQNPQVTASFLLEKSTVEIQTTAPHEEAIDAFLYTFRFFMVNNEDTSFGRMASVYEQLPITEVKKEKFRSARLNFNK